MFKNTLGKTDLLRSLNVGDSVIWHYDPAVTTADKQQKLFTAVLTKFDGIKIKQGSALIVIPGMIPCHVVTIKRIA